MLTLKRAKELINAMIDYASVAEKTSSVINWLLDSGFAADELVNEFSFSRDDVADVLTERENSEDYDHEYIKSLFSAGFTKEEIVSKFGFSNDEIEEALGHSETSSSDGETANSDSNA